MKLDKCSGTIMELRLWNTEACSSIVGRVDAGFYALTIELFDKKEDELIQDCLKEHMQFMKMFREELS